MKNKLNNPNLIAPDQETEAGPEGIEVQIYSSFEELVPMQQEWDDFVESVAGDVYLTFDWCRVWWEFYGRNRHLRIFLFYQDSKLVGVIPTFFERIWIGPVWLKIAKIVGSDSTTNMVNPPVEVDFAVCIFQHVIMRLTEKESCDAVWFAPIAEKSVPLCHLREAIEKNSDVILYKDSVRSPYTMFQLPETFDEYVGSLNKRQRGNLRRDLNLINRSFQMTQEVITDEIAVKHEFGKFVQMHSEQWRSEGKLGHFDDWPLGTEFCARMVVEQAKRGRLRLIRLLADGKAVSYQLCYVFAGRWHWRLPARLVGSDWRKYGLGRIGLIKEIEIALAEGIHEIEAGAGHYDYKVKLGGKEFPLYVIMLIRKQLFCRLRASLFVSLSSLLNYCYYRIWFTRIAPKLPFKRRPLWMLWIRTRL